MVGVASPALKQSIFMKIKSTQILLGSHPLSDTPYWNPVFTPEIRGIKKATWDKKFKNSRRNFKSPKRLNSSPEAPRKKEEFIEMLKNQNS
jgi:hypothetical protein